jgi:hypothetical protein
VSACKTKQTSPADLLEDLIHEWKSLLALRGIAPESEEALRSLPSENAASLLRSAVARLSR